ncbi:hypothetical protein SAMN06296065_11061 [Novosphingobium panipatense]|uniref:Uncharacterized protein n=1 Tax=Novosphingobium panipatense TaxID=428991 RepID=A0ABY1QQZ5_9SPHN|nr:hypothetical protein SAMN06296065_11061 [Novosphingobium panipatense]
MTALAITVFFLAAFTSGIAMIATLREFAATALALRSELAGLSEPAEISWKAVERTQLPPLSPLRKRQVRWAGIRLDPHPGLECAA